MATSYSYTIKLSSLGAVGATCSDISVEWDDLACGNITCIVTDTEIHVQIPDDCQGECVTGLISCNESCTNCVPQPIEICPCSTNADCDACSDCEDNICVSSCDDNETCVDGVCEECPNGDSDCEGLKECVNGECQCPPDLYENDKGECVPCLLENTPNCYICTTEGLIPKECPDGVCDPDTGDCVDCLGSGDCEPNEKCVEGECVCKDGYVRDPNTGDCVLAPECDEDADCPECEECNQYGTCEPIDCPEGYVCDGGDCKKPCQDGTDCPDGSGCNPDTGFCEECSEQDCTTPDCEALLGCECSGDNCVDSDNCDNAPCSNPFDCPEGCTCYEGRCVSCDNFACDDCVVPGCDCISGKCQEDPDFECTDTFEILSEDANCNIKAEAFLEDGCSCTPMTLLFKATNVDSSTDNYATVDLRVEIRKGIAQTFNEAKNLPRLDNTSHPDIADNDLPEQGSVNLKQTLNLIEIDENGNSIAGTQTTDVVFNLNLSFADVAFVDQNNKRIYKKGGEYTLSGDTYRITQVTIEVTQDDDFDFSNRSGCVYDKTNVVGDFVLTEANFNSLADGTLTPLNKFKTIYSDDARNPLFKWYRNDPTDSAYDEDNDVFRKVYVPEAGSDIYRDTLYGPDELPSLSTTTLTPSEGELWAGYGYAAESDCSCNDNYDDFGKVKFCEVEGIDVSFNACLTEFEIETFAPCDVNQDITQWTGVPSNAQVYWDVYVNGSLHGTYQHKDGTGNVENIADSSETLFDTFTTSNSITSMKIVQRTSAITLCEQIISVPANEVKDRDIDYSIDCDRDDKYQVSIDVDQTPVDIDRIIGWNSASSGTFRKSFDKGTTQQVTVVFIDDCRKTITIDPDCCDERTVSANGAIVQEGGSTQVLVTTRGMELPISYTLEPPSGASITGTATTRDFRIDVDNPVDGTYLLTVDDSNPECEPLEPIEVTITVIPDPDVEIFSDNTDPTDFSFCSGGDDVTISVKVNSEYVGSTVHYTRTEVANPSSTTNGTIVMNDSIEELATVSTEYSYSFNKVTLDGNDNFINQTVQTEEVEEPSVTSFTASTNNACLNEEFTLSIEATANSTVTVDNGVGEIAIDSQGDGEATVIPASVGTKVYTVTSISSDACGQSSVTGFSENVVVSEAAVVSGTGACAESNPGSDRELTFEVDQEGGSASAYDNENTGTSLTVTGGGNGDGTSTYTVTLPSTTTVDFVGFEYTNANGCVTKEVQAVPQSCTCPAGTATVTTTDVCQGSGNAIDYEVTQVTVDGSTYSGSQISVEWFEDGVSQSTSNPYSHPTSAGDPAGSVQLGYEVEILTGAHDGCVVTGFASGSIVLAQDAFFYPTTGYEDVPVNEGETTTLCDGASVELESVEAASYQWTLDGANDGTSRTYTFNEAAQATPYTVALQTTDENGCTDSFAVDFFVTSCDCMVQYVDINTGNTSTDALTVEKLYTSDGRNQDISEGIGVYTDSGDTPNDEIVTAIETALTALGDTVSAGNTEVYYQYLDHDSVGVRFYVLNSSIELDKLTTDGEVGEYTFTQDCNGTTVTACTTATADNYNSDLNSTGLAVTITDDGSCFNVYNTALFATDLVVGISEDLGGTPSDNNIDIILDGSSVGTAGAAAATTTAIGGISYNTLLADEINAEAITGVQAAYPTGTEISNDAANLGAEADYCTGKASYIRLYWPFGSDLRLDYVTPGSVSHGQGDVFVDTSNVGTESYTLIRCTGGTGSYVNIAAIDKEQVTSLP